MINNNIWFLITVLFFYSCKENLPAQENRHMTPVKNKILFIDSADLSKTNNNSFEYRFGKYIKGYNIFVLRAIDKIQQKYPDGGGYFIGIHAEPPESPIGYDLKLMGKELIKAPRTTSYCSGASYTAFIEGLNHILDSVNIDSIRLDAIRMQEWDGSRREDDIKLWGNWNTDGFGSYNAMVSYSGIGIKIKPEQARPGDFMNISWKSGNGHSVVFLGWYKKNKQNYIAYWSSQKSTNGLGMDIVNIDKIEGVVVVRISYPERILSFDPNNKVVKTEGETLEFLSK